MFRINLQNKIYNLFNSFFNKNTKPDSIIEPLTCLIRLALLEFKPLNTKLSIYNNRITYDEPNILQGAIRWSNGDNREDIQLNKFDHYFVPLGDWHQITNPFDKPCHLIEILYGEACVEEDIERLEYYDSK